MKVNNYIIGCLCSCLLFSCQNNIEDLSVDTDSSGVIDTRSSLNEDPFEQLIGMPLNIRLANSVGTATYLSLNQVDGPTSDVNFLKPRVTKEDTGNGLQQWVLHKLTPQEEGVTSFEGHNLYIMSMVGQFIQPELKNYQWLDFTNECINGRYSTGYDRNYLYSFMIEPVKNFFNLYYIIGVRPTGRFDLPLEAHRRLYATEATEGSLVKVYYTDGIRDELFRWEFTPADIFEIESISYYQMPEDYISLAPDFISDIIVENETSLEQSMTANFTQKATIQSRFSKTDGFSVTVKAGASINICEILNAGVDVTTVSSTTASFENSETLEDSRSYSFPVRVPPFKKVKACVVVQRYNANISYRAVFKGTRTGRRLTLTGKWEGVTASTITYKLVEGENGKLLRSFTGVPTSEVDLTK